jgi:transposase
MDALVPEGVWAVIAALLPPEPAKPKGGRSRASDRSALAGINSVLRTGLPWKCMPESSLDCSGRTSWWRLGEWHVAGVWANPHRMLLKKFPDANALNWS